MSETDNETDEGEQEEEPAVTLRAEMWVEWEETASLGDVARTINHTQGVSSVEEYTEYLEQRFREHIESFLPTGHAENIAVEPEVRAERVNFEGDAIEEAEDQ